MEKKCNFNRKIQVKLIKFFIFPRTNFYDINTLIPNKNQ